MIYNNVELFNVAEIERSEVYGGAVLQRFPRAVRETLGRPGFESGRVKSCSSTGCEIRFVTDGPSAAVTLSAIEADACVTVYNGDYFHSVHRLAMGVPTRLPLDRPSGFSLVGGGMLAKRRFSPDVWRIFIERGKEPMQIYSVALHQIDTFGHQLRPPHADETPRTRWLAYGSSITHGTGALNHHNAYIHQAAGRLGVDVLNKGIGGACFCEPQIADFFAGQEWDIATLEIGVNMRELFTEAEFEERARYLTGRLLAAKPGRPVALITIYPNAADFALDTEAKPVVRNRSFREILRKIRRDTGSPDLHLIEGDTILTQPDALTVDLIHPSDYGHSMMGQNLADKLRPILTQYGLEVRK